MTRADPHEPSQPNRSYWAFISYSHADQKAAVDLHRYLERLTVPRQLVGRETGLGRIPRRLRPIFRDREEFPASADLGRAIRNALATSRNLIVICSPSAAASDWVGEEIRHFRALGRGDRVFCYVVAGAPSVGGRAGAANGAFPPALVERFDADGGRLPGTAPEPLGVDPVAEGKTGARLKLVAGLLGVDYDDLRQRFRRQAARRAGLAVAVLVGVAACFAAVWLQGRQENRLAQAQHLASTARAIYEDEPLLGLRLALEAAATAPDHHPAALSAIIATGKTFARRGRIAKLGWDVEAVCADGGGHRLVVDFVDRPGELRSGTDGSLVTTLPRPVYRCEFLGGDEHVLVDYRSQSELRRAGDGSIVAELVATARVQFSPDRDRRFFFVTNSGGYPAELRRQDGSIVALQPDSRPASVTFSREPGSRWFVVEYHSPHPPELRRTDDSSVVALPAVPERISYSRDPRTRRMLIRYEDGGWELRRTEDLTVIRRLPEGTQRANFDRSGTLIRAATADGEYTLRSLDGESGPAREAVSDDKEQSYRVELDEEGARWWRDADGQLLGKQPGAFAGASFSRGVPPAYVSLARASGGNEIRRVTDGSLVHVFEQSVSVQLDAEHVIVRYETGAELWRLGGSERLAQLPATSQRDDPAVFDTEYVRVALDKSGSELRRLWDGVRVASLPEDIDGVRYPARGLIEVRHRDGTIGIRSLADAERALATVTNAHEILYPVPGLITARLADGSLEPRRLSDGAVVKWPSTRGIAGTAFLPPDARYSLISYIGRTADVVRTVDGEPVATLAGGGGVAGVTFLPEQRPTHFLAHYEGQAAQVAASELRRISDGAVLATFNGRPTRVDQFEAAASPLLMVRYADGRAELWRGPEEASLLDTLGANLADVRLLEQSDVLVLRHTDGSAYLLDVGWLVAANGSQVSDAALFELACSGPMARLLTLTHLEPYLRGTPSQACR